jgi:hypothetical protein
MPMRLLDRGAEARARELLGSVAGADALAAYEELGFVGVEGRGEYGYLVYPHRPIVAYDARSGELLSEFCVRFPDTSQGGEPRWLPDADDVLAKWMALSADERALMDRANLDPPGRQLDPGMVRRDIERLAAWKEAKRG